MSFASLVAGVDVAAWSAPVGARFSGGAASRAEGSAGVPQSGRGAYAATLLGDEFDEAFAPELLQFALATGMAGTQVGYT